MTATLLTLLFGLTIMLAMTNDAPAPVSNTPAVRTASILLEGDVSRVFPLFGFLEEKKWSRGWDPKVVAMSHTLQDSVFTYSHDGLTATWIVSEFDETSHRATYSVFVPNNRTMTIRIACTAESGNTRAQVTYSFTALSEEGKSQLREFEQQDFSKRIHHWQVAINHYLATGKQWEGDSH